MGRARPNRRGRALGHDKNSRLVYSTGGDPREDPVRRPEVPRRPGQPSGPRSGARLWLDRRASGRLATRITGLTGATSDLQALLKELKAACGAGGSLKDGALELQGDQRDRVEEALRARGIPCKRAGG